MINYITSRNNNKIIHVSKLKNNHKLSKEYQEFLIEGIKAIELALKSNLVKEIYTLKEIKAPYNIPQYIINESVLEKISSSVNPEGVVALCQLIEEKVPEKMDKVVYFDGISDPGNMGTLIRTALAFNYDAVIISEDSVNLYNQKVINATKGAMFLIPILIGDISKYRTNQTIITSTLNEKSISLDELKKPQSFMLVLGNEAHGVSQKVINNTDIFVKIPISNIDSLNVSIAGGILMNHLK